MHACALYDQDSREAYVILDRPTFNSHLSMTIDLFFLCICDPHDRDAAATPTLPNQLYTTINMAPPALPLSI